MTDRRVLLVAHTGRPEVARTAAAVCKRLGDAGIELRLAGAARAASSSWRSSTRTTIPTHRSRSCWPWAATARLLRAAEHARPLSAPVLGINLGRVGFLTEVDVDAPGRGARRDHRPAVPGVVPDDGRGHRRARRRLIATGWALNEISVEKGTRERILDVVVEVDGHGVSAYGCDGVLIATPTGSTAYTFSAGGPVLWPGVDALLVAPSNAHALFARSLVVSPECTVTVHIDPAGQNAVLACDGRRIHEIPPGSRVHVRKGEKPVTLVRLTDQVVHRPIGAQVQTPGARLARPAVLTVPTRVPTESGRAEPC